MTSSEKLDVLLNLDRRNAKAEITTVQGDVYYYKLSGFAEDEDDWAFHFVSPDFPTKYFILEYNFIAAIEEITEDKWQIHLQAARY